MTNWLQFVMTQIFCCRENPASVTSVGVGDFDGDGLVDLLTLAPTSSGCSVARVHWISLNQGGIPQVSGEVFSSV